jgi:hypothetical protein
MSSEQPSEPEAIPEDLRHLIHSKVLCCVECKEAVRPQSLVEHLKRKHRVAWEVRARVKRYINGFGHDYEHSTIGLPDDGLGPQPLLPISSGFNCRKCNKFRSPNAGRMRRHGNTEHGLRWIADFDEIFEKVQIQTWFSNGRQRYWIVAAAKGSSPKQGGRRGKRRAESIEPDEAEAAVPDQGRRQKRRQITGTGVDKQAHGGSVVESVCGGSGVEPAHVGSVVGESGDQKEEVMANSAKRTVSVEAGKIEGGIQKQVRFAEHVEVGGVGGLKQQLDRWSKECPVCYFTWPDRPSTDRLHQVWGCPQEAAKRVRMYSQLMDRGVQGVQVQVEKGCCRGCGLPAAICAKWQWNKGQEKWEEDKETRCQYEGVLMPAMVAMIELGKEEGAKRVQGLGWASGEWVSKRIWWLCVRKEGGALGG